MLQIRRRGIQGFTLVEILVSLLLLTTALVVLAEGYVNTLNALRGGEDQKAYDLDVAFVRERILQISDRETLENGGTLETLSSGAAVWEAEVAPTNILDVHRLSLWIDFIDLDKVHYQEVVVLRPGLSDPVDREDLLQEKKEDLDQSRFGKEWAY